MVNRPKRIKLDKKDRKILFELDFDARRTNASIARKVSLSKQGVEYKIQKMKNKGIIERFYPIINITALGYHYCRFTLKFHNLKREKQEKIINEITNYEKCVWAIKTEGDFDLLIGFALKNMIEYLDIIKFILGKYGKYINEKRESLAINVVHFQNRFLTDSPSGKRVLFHEGSEKINLDKLDKKILKLLSEDARMNLLDISRQLNKSARVISYRINRMERRKVLLGYRPFMNNKIIGLKRYKIFFRLTNVTEEEYNKFREYLKAHPSVIYIIDEIGICDIDVDIMLSKDDHFFTFMQDLKFKFPRIIENYKFAIVDKTLKLTYLPPKSLK